MSSNSTKEVSPVLAIPAAITLRLQDIHLIEASAGTGKTWTLSVLFIRLILETQMDARQLIVATFTRMAASDLRERLKERLEQTIQFLESPPASDAQLSDPFESYLVQNFLADEGIRTEALKRLTLIKNTFDEILITTLDGMGQRLLKEFAIECGVVVERELVTEEKELLEPIIHAAIRAYEASSSPIKLKLLDSQGKRANAENILSILINLLAKPNACLQLIEKPQNLSLEALIDLVEQLQKDDLQWFEILRPHFYGRRKLDTNAEHIPALYACISQLNWPTHSIDEKLTLIINILNHKPFMELLEGFAKLETNLTKKGQTLAASLDQPFFPALWQQMASELFSLQDHIEHLAQFQNSTIIHTVLDHWYQQLAERQQTTFGQQMQTLKQALSHPENGKKLAAQIFQRFPYALIDEFQDTNQTQTDILLAIYHDQPFVKDLPKSTLILVGDPKQAIYGFRGGDIHAYLSTKKSIEERQQKLSFPLLHSLDFNQRSVAPLVQITDHLLQQNSDLGDGVVYPPTFASSRPHAALIENNKKNAWPLRWIITDNPDTPQQNKSWQHATTSLTTNLLEKIQTRELCLHTDDINPSTPLTPNDIAVLCNTNDALDQLKQLFEYWNIPYRIQRQQSIYATSTALALFEVMQLWLKPYLEENLRSLMLGPLFNLDLVTLDQHSQDTNWLSRYQLLFGECATLWQQYGFMSAWIHFANQTKIWEKIGKHRDGKRQIIDLKHLLELIENQSQTLGGVHQTLYWYTRQLQQRSLSDNTQQRPLPQKEGVWLMTIHASKGLEFPIVILPNHAKKGADKSNMIYEQGQYVYLFNKNDSQKEQIRQSETAENLRKTYVALTRAKYRLYIIQEKDIPDNVYKHWLPEGIAAFCQQYNDQSIIEYIPAARPYQPFIESDAPKLSFESIALKPIHNSWRSTSFSSLITGHDYEQALAGATLAGEKKHTSKELQDQLQLQIEQMSFAFDAPIESVCTDKRIDIRASFPKGAQSGNLLHQLLQYIDARSPSNWERDRFLTQAVLNILPDTLLKDELNQWLSDIVNTVLPSGSTLKQLGYGQQAREMDFQLSLSGQHIDEALLRARLAQENIFLGPLQQSQWVRFLNGAIDLVYEDHGRYFIADYKSNFLGANLLDYSTDNMKASMNEAGYWLQAALYLVVLHRHLSLRLPNYDIRQHLGGACYLYLRGMHPDSPQTGMVYWQPPLELILDLSDILTQSSAAFEE